MGIKKKITILIPSLAGGGAERMAINLANEFSKKTHAVTIFTLTSFNDYGDIVDKNVKIIKSPFKRIRYSPIFLLLYLIKERSHYILSFTRDSSVILGILNTLLFSRHKLFFREETLSIVRKIVDLNYKKKFLGRLFISLIYSTSKCIISQCNDIDKDIKELLLFSFSDFKVIQNPVIPDKFYKSFIKKSSEKWFKDEKIQVIIFIGRLNIIKDITTLIKAFYKLNNLFPHTRLIICGKGEEEKNLRKLVNDLNLDKFVLFKGFVNNSFELTKASNIYCMTSIAEGYGNSLIEAMAVGIKIVCSKMKEGGVKDHLANNKFVNLFEPSNVNDLYKSLAQALYTPEYSPYMIEESKKFKASIASKKYLECINKY